MDRRSIIFGIVFFVAAFALMQWQGSQLREAEAQQAEQPKEVAGGAKAEEAQGGGKAVTASASLFEKDFAAAGKGRKSVVGKEYVLENEVLRLKFTTRGGALKEAELKQFPMEKGRADSFTFNKGNGVPAMGLLLGGARGESTFVDSEYEVVFRDANRILLKAALEGVDIYRGYSINNVGKDEYVVVHETKFVNKTQQEFSLRRLYVSLGSFPGTEGDTYGEYLNLGYYDSKKVEFIKINEFKGSNGFLGFGKKAASEFIDVGVGPVEWASVKNQFFATVLTPKEGGVGIKATPIQFANGEQGITGSVAFDLGLLESGKEKLLSMDFYVGPKEFARLDKMGRNQDLVMQFGFFGGISKLLLLIMKGVNHYVPNWGWTIILFTVIIKGLMWPLTAIQVRSSKRMARIQKPLQEIREKFKDNPQKQQMETIKLFKENKVNPAAGCLPLLIQIPIFLGLYFMLRSTSELRFAEFLWIKDLSVADTVGRVAGFPINVLPFLMGLSMLWQMRVTPSPTADGFQKTLFQFLPFIFLFFCYSFPAGLVLYWTVQNLLTVAQQYITTRWMKDEVVAGKVETVNHSQKTKKNKKNSTLRTR